jgi:hypothetical protein
MIAARMPNVKNVIVRIPPVVCAKSFECLAARSGDDGVEDEEAKASVRLDARLGSVVVGVVLWFDASTRPGDELDCAIGSCLVDDVVFAVPPPVTVTRFVCITVVMPDAVRVCLVDGVADGGFLQENLSGRTSTIPPIGAAVHSAGHSLAAVTTKPHGAVACRPLLDGLLSVMVASCSDLECLQ